MSRGPGVTQRRVLEALDLYDGLGSILGWMWQPGGSFNRKYLTDIPRRITRSYWLTTTR
jgi:hypothetical protein